MKKIVNILRLLFLPVFSMMTIVTPSFVSIPVANGAEEVRKDNTDPPHEFLPAPFSVGEKLTFRLRWGVFVAANATMEVAGIEEVHGFPCYHLVFNVRSTSFVDTVYKVRTSIESWVTLDGRRTMRFIKDQDEGGRKQNIRVEFDPVKGTATYSDISRNDDPISVPDEIFDPLSVLFAFRRLELVPDTHYNLPLTDGKKQIVGQGRIIRREQEQMSVPAGDFDVLYVLPRMDEIGGLFRKEDSAAIEIWVSDDEKKIPVRMQSRVRIGSFVAELTDYKPGVGSGADFVTLNDAPVIVSIDDDEEDVNSESN